MLGIDRPPLATTSDGAVKPAVRRRQRESAVAGAVDAVDAATGLDAHAGGRAFVEQHLHDLLRRLVAEQLPEFLLVVGDAVAIDHAR